MSVVTAACTETSTTTTEEAAATTTTRDAGTTTTSTTMQESSAEFMEGACEFEVPPNRTVECGWLEVPEDRSDPSKGTIRLHVATFKAPSDNPAPDPVVYLEGGPGGEILEAVPLIFEDRFGDLLPGRDLIIFDQRGTGYSEPSLACQELRDLGFELLEQDVDVETARSLELAAIEECRDRLVESGADLDSYSSAESAADLEDLRLALGIEEWNLYGISYGTRLALAAMRAYPEGIRSVLLDSVLPPDADLYVELAENLDRALNELFEGCAADPTCSDAYPDLESDFYALLEELEANPLRVPVTDIFTGQGYNAVIDGSTLGGIVFQGLYSEEVIPLLPQLIDHAGTGETFELSVLLTSFLANGEFISAGMQFSVQCSEEVTFSSREEVESALAEFPSLDIVFGGVSNLGPAIFEICATWEAGGADPVENEAVVSDIPTLVYAGEYDPITPPRWGEQAAETLENSTYIVFPGVGHGPSATVECPRSIFQAFLDDPSAEVSLDCVEEMTGPLFVTDDTPVPEVVLVEYSENVLGATVAGVVPEGWESQAPGVWSRGATGFDQTAVVQQFAPGVTSELLIASLGPNFGLDPSADPASTYEPGWELYETSIGGVPADVAVRDTGSGTLLVILVTSPYEQAALREDVLFPALDAISVG